MAALRRIRDRRAELQAECGARRERVARCAADIAARCGLLDRAVAVARSSVARPWLVSGAVALALVAGPRRTVRWATVGTLAWRLARGLAALFGRAAGSRAAGGS